jgi:hypothetical protein
VNNFYKIQELDYASGLAFVAEKVICHLNYMAHMYLPLSFRLLIAAHASQTTLIVCRVSSGKPESSTFYNSYRINKGVVTTLQHLI